MAGVKKEEPKQEGAPEWMTTYGDMMTLLLCFFVILVAMSEIKEEEKFRSVIASLAEAFGYEKAQPTVPGQNESLNSLLQQINSLAPGRKRDTRAADVNAKARKGPQRRVKRIRDGLKVTLGAPLTFKEGSAELGDEQKQVLDMVAGVLRGKPNKIVIQGHTTRKPLPAGSPFADHWDLAYARAKAVQQHLVSQSGIDPQRIRISSAADYEPVRETRDDRERALNGRVDIFVTEAYIRDYIGGTVGAPANAPDVTRLRTTAPAGPAQTITIGNKPDGK